MRQLMGSSADDGTVRDLLCRCRRPGAARRGRARRGRGRRARRTRRADRDAARARPRGVGRRGRLRRRGPLGRVRHGRARVAVRRGRRPRPARRSPAASRSGSRSSCCSAPTPTCCCSTSPTTSSTSRPRSGSRASSQRCKKTVLFVSHDRELLARAASKIVTLEGARRLDPRRRSFATYHEARDARLARLDDQHRRYAEERKRLEESLQRVPPARADGQRQVRVARPRHQDEDRALRGDGAARAAARPADLDAALRRPHRQARR